MGVLGKWYATHTGVIFHSEAWASSYQPPRPCQAILQPPVEPLSTGAHLLPGVAHLAAYVSIPPPGWCCRYRKMGVRAVSSQVSFLPGQTPKPIGSGETHSPSQATRV